MTDEQIQAIIEGTGPVLDAVFPEWDKGHREMVMSAMLFAAVAVEEDINSARAARGLAPLP